MWASTIRHWKSWCTSGGGRWSQRSARRSVRTCNVALVIDIGQASVHDRRRMRGVQLIMAVRVEARRIAARAILQDTTPLWMVLCRLTLGYEAPQGGTHDSSTHSGEEGSPAEPSGRRVPVHGGP